MKRTLRILLAILGVLIATFAAVLITLAIWFDPNDYKAEIHAAIERQLGRAVTIEGDIGLSVFPWLGLELGPTRLANAEGFGDEPMAEIAAADIRVKLLPLLSRDIEVGAVELDGLRLRLARNAQGRSNWADIQEHLAAADQSADAESSQGSETDGPEQEGFALSSLQIGAIAVSNAAVSWRDATTGADYRIENMSLSTGRLVDGEAVRTDFSGELALPERDISADLDLVARIQPDFIDRFFRFSDLSLTVLASGEGLPHGRQQANLSGSGEYDGSEGRLKIEGINLKWAGLEIEGNVDGTGLNAEPTYTGRVTLKQFDPRAVMRELAIEAPATQDSGKLSSAGFDAQFTATPQALELRQILATLDASSLKGSARVVDYAAPDVRFELALDQLNVDDYLPPGSAEQAQGEPAENDGGQSQRDAELDLDLLEALRLQGDLTIGDLTVANMDFHNAALAVQARDGVLVIDPLTADLYQGNLRLVARVDASAEPPRYTLRGNLNGLQFQPLLADVAGTERLSALANLSLNLTSAGRQVADMKRALDGRFAFDMRDGAFAGFNLAELIAAARARLGGGEPAATGLGGNTETPFNRFAANLAIEDGMVSGDDLRLDTGTVDATGSGRYDLADNALDYVLTARIAEDAPERLTDLSGLALPIRLSGPLLSPDYSLDLEAALRGAADRRLGEEKERIREALQSRLDAGGRSLEETVRSRIQQGLDGLFGGDDETAGEGAEQSASPDADSAGPEEANSSAAPAEAAAADAPQADGARSTPADDAPDEPSAAPAAG